MSTSFTLHCYVAMLLCLVLMDVLACLGGRYLNTNLRTEKMGRGASCPKLLKPSYSCWILQKMF